MVRTCHRPLVIEHLHRYALACGIVKTKRVLDIACGEGFGSGLLASSAALVLGIDNNGEIIEQAREQYRCDNLSFRHGFAEAIPCCDQSFDVVISFDTLEHLSEHERFVAEVKRVLVPQGLLLISTPNKSEYDASISMPNPFHRRELEHDEFTALLQNHFKHVLPAKQRLVAGSWIAPDTVRTATATWDGSFDSVTAQSGVNRGMYSIAVCSDHKIPPMTFGVFDNFVESSAIWELLDCYGSVADLLQAVKSPSEIGNASVPDSRPSMRIRQLELDLQLAMSQRDQLGELVRTLLDELSKHRAVNTILQTRALAHENGG